MDFTLWCLVVGGLLVLLALGSTLVERLPITTAMLYLAVGVALGPLGVGAIRVAPLAEASVIERVTEVAVLISLFCAGLKLRLPLDHLAWRAPVRLAVVSMLLTVGLVTVVGVFGLGLPLGAAVLLGGVLAPTDPVLAGDVTVEHPGDNDRLRFALTGEAGLNDGTAFPIVLLGLGLLGLHDLGAGGWRWFAVDVGWAIASGLGIGWALGNGVGRLVLYLRARRGEAVGTDDFLALGLIAFSYGLTLLVSGYGFLAVFAAGLSVRRVERRAAEGKERDLTDSADRSPVPLEPDDSPDDVEETRQATDPQEAPGHLTEQMLDFNEQIERIGELAVVVLLGGMLAWSGLFPRETIWFVPLMLLVVRPLSAVLGLIGSPLSRPQRRLVGWFGIRGIGSIYYLFHAVTHGLPTDLAGRLVGLTLSVVVVSIAVHGLSVTPLMRRYREITRRSVQSGRR